MKLNLPILDQLADCQTILIAGAGGGFDFLGGVPLFFALREMGKTVHLANYTFTEFSLTKVVSNPDILVEELVLGANRHIQMPVPYYPEGYFAEWCYRECGEELVVWMLAKTGAAPLARGYRALVQHLGVEALILVDGGVDSIMVGDEHGAGTLVEDSITLAATRDLEVPVKILACLGFGAEVEESVCHYNALENMAALVKAGGFLGACALTPQMEVFQKYEAAGRYIMGQPDHLKSHIHTRVIPAVRGEFGNHAMFPDVPPPVPILVSPLMSLYWFFDAQVVTAHNKLIDVLIDTNTTQEAFNRVYDTSALNRRRIRQLPY